MPATHTEKCRALSTHALTDRLAGKMEMKADRKLTYAYNTHEDTLYGHLYTHVRAYRTPTELRGCIPAMFFLEPVNGDSTHGFLYTVLLQSAPFLIGRTFMLGQCDLIEKRIRVE